VIYKDRVVLNKLENCGKDKGCHMKHVDELVMIIWILCIHIAMQGTGFLPLE